MWWLDRIGMLDERVEHLTDPAEARQRSSLQLIGDPCHRNIDVGTLRDEGVEVAGRLADIHGMRVTFAGDLGESTRSAHQRLERMIARIDAFANQDIGHHGTGPEAVPALVVEQPPQSLDLHAAGIRTVLWATGFRAHYPWLKLPILDARGNIVQDGGVCRLPGTYALGLRFMRRRKSSFIDGCGPDAQEIADLISARLHARRIAAA
jgi:putative flavoprotein involved in K+ transport